MALRFKGIEYEADPEHRRINFECFRFDDRSGPLMVNIGRRGWRTGRWSFWEKGRLKYFSR
eukprot:9087426-Karenia_brevis.AAC.1